MIWVVSIIALILALVACAAALYALVIGYHTGNHSLSVAASYNDLVSKYNKAIKIYDDNAAITNDWIKNLDERVKAGNVSEATLKEFIDIYNREVALANAEVDTLINLGGEKPPPKGELN